MHSAQNTAKSVPAWQRLSTLLWFAILFLALAETICGIAVTRTTGAVQIMLTVFLIVLPLIVALTLFTFLLSRHWQPDPPSQIPFAQLEAVLDAVRGVNRKTDRIEKKLEAAREQQRLARLLPDQKSEELWKHQLEIALTIHGAMVRFTCIAGEPKSEAHLTEAIGRYLASAVHMNLLLPKEICDAIGEVSTAAIKLTDSFCEKGRTDEGLYQSLWAAIRSYEQSVRTSLHLELIDKTTHLSDPDIQSRLLRGIASGPDAITDPNRMWTFGH